MKTRTSKRQALLKTSEINPMAVYSRPALQELLGFSRYVFIRAENEGCLIRQKGPGSARYVGVNVLKWLGVNLKDLNIQINIAQGSEGVI